VDPGIQGLLATVADIPPRLLTVNLFTSRDVPQFRQQFCIVSKEIWHSLGDAAQLRPTFLTLWKKEFRFYNTNMNGHTNGNTNPSKLVNGSSSPNDDQQAVKEIRKLIIDCHVAKMEEDTGGSAIGMAPLAVALWRHTMRYNPSNPNWFDRDRFVLSNGHAAMLLYTMLHVTGYKDLTIDELKMYGNAKAVDKSTGKWKSTICHGRMYLLLSLGEITNKIFRSRERSAWCRGYHWSLGQGIANAVGLALHRSTMLQHSIKRTISSLPRASIARQEMGAFKKEWH
jgi:transketolase N-terminal domain/subunit